MLKVPNRTLGNLATKIEVETNLNNGRSNIVYNTPLLSPGNKEPEPFKYFLAVL